MLWFDVEKNGYTTSMTQIALACPLWFDVEKNGYTTTKPLVTCSVCCGLM